MIELDSLQSLRNLPADEIIDVRSPAEYAEDHIPGAISLPVLDDAERARVGTLYKQVDPFTARKVGAALVAQNAARHLQGPLADRPYRWQPLVYCWRGGQRSNAFASILTQIGWRAQVVAGGYKSYRRLVVRLLYEAPGPLRLLLIDGGTGTAKTRMLALLAEAGAQVLDLEAMAAHRGSLFGGMPGGQPAQKMFESRLAQAVAALDLTRPVFAEAEAAKIGDLVLPKALWQAMLAAPRVELSAPLAARAAYLAGAYADVTADPALLAARLGKLRPFHAATRIEAWHALAAAGEFRQLAAELMAEHYDPRYARAAAFRPAPMLRLALPDLSDAALQDALPAILRAGEAAPLSAAAGRPAAG